MPAVKTACAVSREQFRGGARPVVQGGDVPLLVEAKEFSTGSLGWYAGGKVTLLVDGTPVAVQVGINLTVANSKKLPAA